MGRLARPTTTWISTLTALTWLTPNVPTQNHAPALPMAQFLRMGRGAVIPLDAGVNDEVWILANNHPIARGEIQINEDRIAIAVTGAADVYDYMAGAA